MDLGYPVRTIDRLHVRSLLEQRRFDALDTLFAALRDSVHRDFRLEYRLHDAYAAFSIPAQAMGPLFDEWLRLRPASPTARFSRASHAMALGWQARGTGYLDETPAADVRRFRGYMESARADLAAGLRQAPCDIMAYEMLMQAARMAGDTTASPKLLRQGLSISPYSFLLRARHMNHLLPRWGGTYGAMDAFADESESLVARNPRLRALRAFVLLDLADRLQSDSGMTSALGLYGHAIAAADYWAFRLERARLLAGIDRDAEALDDLQRAMAQRPQHRELLLIKAMSHYAVGRNAPSAAVASPHFRQAFVDIELARRLDPTDKEVLETIVFFRRNIPEFEPARAKR